MQTDAFPDPRCARELALAKRGEFRTLEKAYRDAADTILINPNMDQAERQRRHEKWTATANHYAAEAMDRELPW